MWKGPHSTQGFWRPTMAVVKFAVTRREPVLDGAPFGKAGAYEKIVGVLHFATNPSLRTNEPIADLGLALRNAQGLVESSADFYLLRPTGGGNRRLFLDVPNRGRKVAGGLALRPRRRGQDGGRPVLHHPRRRIRAGEALRVPVPGAGSSPRRARPRGGPRHGGLLALRLGGGGEPLRRGSRSRLRVRRFSERAVPSASPVSRPRRGRRRAPRLRRGGAARRRRAARRVQLSL